MPTGWACANEALSRHHFLDFLFRTVVPVVLDKLAARRAMMPSVLDAKNVFKMTW